MLVFDLIFFVEFVKFSKNLSLICLVLSFLLSEEGLGTASGMDFYAITVNGFRLVVTVKRSVLAVASFLDSSLNPFPYIRFNISKGV